MKRLASIALILFASCACAEIMEFENFSLDIPEGWTAREDGQVVTVTSYYTSARLIITTARPDGESIGNIAESFARELGGIVLESDDEGNYTFEFDDGRSIAALAGGDDMYMLIIGIDVAESDKLGEILDTLELK